MSTFRILRTTPLAAALLIGCSLMIGCHHDEADETAVPPAATAMPPAAMTAGMPASTTTGMENPATMPPGSMSSAAPASTTANAMGGDMGATGPITDTDFYRNALSGGEKEIAASKLAEKSSNADVKSLAKTIITDHTALGDKVKAAAGASAPTPATPDMSELTGKTGADLDKAYVDMMVSDHQKDIPMFENASKNASTDKAKQLATAALPKLRKHLDMAQKAQASLMK